MAPISVLTPISLLVDTLTSTKSIIILTSGASIIRENDIRGFFAAMDLCNYQGIDGIYIDCSVPESVRDIAIAASTCRQLPILDTIPEAYKYKPKAA